MQVLKQFGKIITFLSWLVSLGKILHRPRIDMWYRAELFQNRTSVGKWKQKKAKVAYGRPL